MKTLFKKISSQAFSCITNQNFSSNNSNSSSIWGGSVEDVSSPTRVNGLHSLWTNATNHPTNLIPQSPNNELSAMRLSEDSLTSISTSIGHNSTSVHEGLSTPGLTLGNSDLDPLMFGRPEVFNKLVEDYTNLFGTKLLNLPESSILDRVHNLHVLQGTPVNPNTLFDKPELLINTLNSIITTIPSTSKSLPPIENVASSSTTPLTPITPVSMDQINIDLQQYLADDVIKVIEEATKIF